jgi:predicted MFS family arabinose efflux permease
VTIPPLAAPALIFFCNAFLYISMFSRLPGLVDHLGIDKGLLGLSLLGGTVGTFMALPYAGRLVQHLTPRVAAALMLPAIAVIQVIAFSVPAYWAFVLCFVGFGWCRALLEVAQNLVATQIEAETGKHVMSRSHGFWSVGLLVGSLFSGLVSGLGIIGWQHMVLAGLVVLGLVAVLLRIAPRTSHGPAPARQKFFAVPDRAILVVCAMMFGIAITEGAIYDWAAFYIRQVLDGEPAAVGILFSCFTVGMASTRMVGDVLRARFPAPTIVRCSALSAFIGVSVLLLAPNLYVAALGLVLIGCGVAINAPLAVATAARIGSRSPSENLAALSMVNTLAFLAVPASLGFVSDQFGLKFAFALLLVPLIVSFALAPITGTRADTATNGTAPAQR